MVVRIAAPVDYEQTLFDNCSYAAGHDACDMPSLPFLREVPRRSQRGPKKAPAFWGEEEPRREVKAYQPDMPTEYSVRRRGGGFQTGANDIESVR